MRYDGEGSETNNGMIYTGIAKGRTTQELPQSTGHYDQRNQEVELGKIERFRIIEDDRQNVEYVIIVYKPFRFKGDVIMRAVLFVLMAFLLTSVLIYPQEKGESQRPKTKLEAFVAQDGVVIVKGFSEIGTFNGNYGGSVIVEAKEFINVNSVRREYGITIEVKETGGVERENRSYIDYDEIDSLIKGLEYIAKVDRSATKLQDFQADYKTRGDLTISTFSRGTTTMVAIESGQIYKATVFFPLSDLQNFKNLIVQAKAKLDSIKQ